MLKIKNTIKRSIKIEIDVKNKIRNKYKEDRAGLRLYEMKISL